MKKIISFLVIVSFLVIPFVANAALIKVGSGEMDLAYSPPTGGGYYVDYDGKVTSSDFSYTTDWEEVFCVSGERLADGSFDFYSLASGLEDSQSQAAWIADNWTTYIGSNDPDTIKGEAQKAVWAYMGVMNIMYGSGIDYTIYSAASTYKDYTTNNWLLAINTNDTKGQDYLVPYHRSVPEPATMLLFGTGLIGLAGLGRKRFLKK